MAEQYVTASDLEKIVRGFNGRLRSLEVQEHTHRAGPLLGYSLAANWADFAAPYGGGYWKDNFGVVHLEGLVTTTNAGAGTTILTLPTGYRPGHYILWPTIASNASSQYCFLRMDLDTAGVLTLSSTSLGGNNFTASGTPNVAWVALNGISFKSA